MNTETTPPKFPLTSMDVAGAKRQQLKQLFPEAFTEARDAKTGELKHAVDWDKLRASLGDVLEREGERFGLSWPGKSALLKVIQQPSVGTLKPCREESVNFDETENLFIEGDNLEVLKLLQKSYFGKVKMIYIDPPYNTGHEFVYPDKFTETLETYLQYTGMVDAKGRKFSTNAATEGRFHSKWLNMMYPRLFLARNLLKETGVILISIDDGEVKNLRGICDEIYGEENFLANIIWEKKYSPQNDAKYFSDSHEHLLMYAKHIEDFEIGLLPRTEEANSRYKNPDNDPRGPWKSSDLTRQEYRERDDYEIISPVTGASFSPPVGNSWGRPKDVVESLIADNRIWFGPDGNSRPSIKRFLSDVKQGITPQTIWHRTEVGDTQEGKKRIKELFGDVSVFETAKPVRLINRGMLTANCSKDGGEIILDFFGGSGTTAEAVIKQNSADGGNRRFVLVQLPEPIDRKKLNNVADIGKERIRLVIQEIKKGQEGELDLVVDKKKQDLGFKVFKLSESNFKTWQGDDEDPAKLQEQLEMHVNHVDPSSTPEDILYELLLKAGQKLTTKVEKISISDKSAYSIEGGALIICLDEDLTKEAIQAIAALKPVQCICLDAAFHENDQLKTNAVQTMESAKVQFRTV